jgi:hypothetical protein
LGPFVTRTYFNRIGDTLINLPSIEQIIRSCCGLAPFNDKTSYLLMRIEPLDGTGWRSTSTELLSDRAVKFICDRIHFLNLKLSELLSSLLLTGSTCGIGLKIFRQAVHRKFSSGFSFRPIGITYVAPPLELNTTAVNENDIYFFDLPSRVGTISFDETRGCYLVPLLKAEKSFDSIWLSKDLTVLFRVCGSHSIDSHEITELTDALPGNASKNIRIVFVQPQVGTFTWNQGRDVDNKYPQYIYHLDVRLLDFA